MPRFAVSFEMDSDSEYEIEKWLADGGVLAAQIVPLDSDEENETAPPEVSLDDEETEETTSEDDPSDSEETEDLDPGTTREGDI